MLRSWVHHRTVQYRGQRASSNNFLVDGVSANFGVAPGQNQGAAELARHKRLAHSEGRAAWFLWKRSRSFASRLLLLPRSLGVRRVDR